MKILNINIIIIMLFCSSFGSLNFAQCEKTKGDTLGIIELKEFYDGKGIIFGKDENYYGYSDSTDQRISLTLTDVKEAESILDSLINLYYADNTKRKNEQKKLFRGYYRQYWGFISNSNEKKIIMFLFNFNDPRSLNYFKDNWNKGFFFGTTDLYNNNTRIFVINLAKRKMEKGSDPIEPYK